MATAAIFTLLCNDGKQDKMLMASETLSKRLCMIRQIRKARGEADPSPTLYDIERSHMLFTNAQFKPFCATAFEYSKQSSSQGQPTFGSSVTFNIAQFGDFFADIALHAILRGPAAADVTGLAALPVSDQPLYRWCDYPGERMLKTVKFTVSSNPLDDYTRDEANIKRELFIPPWKLEAWKRCVGQESALSGTVAQPNWAGSGVAASAIQHRAVASVLNSYQTPRGFPVVGETLELTIPLHLWFAEGIEQAVASVAIPSNQRNLEVELCAAAEMLELVPRGAGTWAAPGVTLPSTAVTVTKFELYINNVFVAPDVHDIYIARVGFNLIRVHRRQEYPTTQSTGEIQLTSLKWPIEYMAIGMKVRANTAPTTAEDIRRSLDCWHQFHQVARNSYANPGSASARRKGLLSAAGVPLTVASIAVTTGVITFSAVPAAGQVVAGDVLEVRGMRFVISDPTVATMVVAPVPLATITFSAVAPAVLPLAFIVGERTDSAPVSGDVIEILEPVRTLNNTTLQAHGIDLYRDFEHSFFNSYLPYRYGKCLNSPARSGLIFIPFCLKPGEYQPSGHINISRAREFFLKYSSDVIGTGTEGKLLIAASALNFLLISDGSATLRFST